MPLTTWIGKAAWWPFFRPAKCDFFSQEFLLKIPQTKTGTALRHAFARTCTIEIQMDIFPKQFFDAAPQGLQLRACGIEMHMDIPQEQFSATIKGKSRDCELVQSKSHARIYRKMPHPRTLAYILRGHGYLTTEIYCENLQGKCHAPELRPILCTSLHNRNAHRYITSMREFARKVPRPMIRTTPTAQAFCQIAQAKCTWTSHKATCRREFRVTIARSKERILV